jgi:hypothetical protein
MTSRPDDARYEAYRQAQIEAGREFQDFVVDVLDQYLHLHIQQYASRRYQYAVGESRNGIEIKHDKAFNTYGRLWIEYAEKAFPRPGAYVASGIMRPDNWLYVIGDYHTLFGFPTKLLRAFKRQGRHARLENTTHTSLAFGLPLREAHDVALWVLEPASDRVVVKEPGTREWDWIAEQLRLDMTRDTRQSSLFPSDDPTADEDPS